MRPYGWLIALSALIATSHAWPGLPHLGLRQAGNTNAASTQKSVQGTCKRIAALTNLSNMVANQTALATMLANKKLTQEQIDYMETQKDAIKSELQELSSNTTLTTECGIIDAHRKAAKACKKLDKLEKLAEMANNKTAYDEHLAGELLNKEQVEQLKKNIEDAEVKLQELRSNSTLVKLCTNEVSLQQNGASEQEVGDIGEAAVDNSGAISLSTSDATTIWLRARLTPCTMAFGAFGALMLF